MSAKDAVRIVDPVHGYITITPIERGLLDSRPAQRLRYVGQSGLAHLVFPDLRTSRFVHSLGAMHLASRFLLASLENAREDDRKAAEKGICDAVEEVVPYSLHRTPQGSCSRGRGAGEACCTRRPGGRSRRAPRAVSRRLAR